MLKKIGAFFNSKNKQEEANGTS